jgi:glutamyl/glutaminyl-tRNA synthetase
MVSVFDISQLKTSAPIFDVEKLRWMNGEYIRMMSNDELMNELYAFDSSIPKNDELMLKVLPLVKERMKTLAEFWSLAGFFFGKPKEFERSINIQMSGISASALKDCLWIHDAMEKSIREASEKAGLKPRDVFMELRLAVTGKTVGPPLLESLEILGKEETFKRLSFQA